LKSLMFSGIVQSVLVTPFDENGEVDYESFRALVDFLEESAKGSPFVFTPCGTTGEGYSLTDDEWRKVVEIAVEEAGSSHPVVPGVIENSVKRAISKARLASELGAQGVMVVLPSYVVPSEMGLIEVYREIAKSADIGVVVYNNPDVSKIYMKPHLLRSLAEASQNVVGVKENTPSVSMLYSQIKTAGDFVPIWQGRGEWWYTATFHLGVRGFASGLSNFAPKLVAELLKAGLDRDLGRLELIREKLWKLEAFFAKMEAKYGPSTTILPSPYAQSYVSISVIKAAMSALGLPGGVPRLPLTRLQREDVDALKAILYEELGLQPVA